MAEIAIKKRPKNLDLTTINLPLPGKVSILHRVSGVGLFLCLPLLLWLFSASLTSPETFAAFKSVFSNLLVKAVLGKCFYGPMSLLVNPDISFCLK